MTSTQAPNHHAHHPPFRGTKGAIAALSMVFGRDACTDLAIRLAEPRPSDRLVDVTVGNNMVNPVTTGCWTPNAVDPAVTGITYCPVMPFAVSCCSAGPGYDAASGWGIPRFPSLLAAVRAATGTSA